MIAVFVRLLATGVLGLMAGIGFSHLSNLLELSTIAQTMMGLVIVLALVDVLKNYVYRG